jgi:WXG100 family type VII secretion target
VAYIHVDHSQFEKTAREVDAYVEKQRRNMQYMDQEVKSLTSTWAGEDSRQFQSQWGNVQDGDSISKKMEKAFENYAKFLRYAADQYKDAQAKAVNMANDL